MEAEKIPPLFEAIKVVNPVPAPYQEPGKRKGGNSPAALPHQAGNQPETYFDEKVMVESGDFARLEEDKARFQEVALSIRNSDQALETLDGYLQKMQSLVEGFVKHYPPFPPESRQQLELIKQFNALWHLVKKLEIPPEADGNGQGAASRQAASRDNTLWLGINELPHQIPEGGLDDRLKELESARTKVAERRKALARKAASIAAGI